METAKAGRGCRSVSGSPGRTCSGPDKSVRTDHAADGQAVAAMVMMVRAACIHVTSIRQSPGPQWPAHDQPVCRQSSGPAVALWLLLQASAGPSWPTGTSFRVLLRGELRRAIHHAALHRDAGRARDPAIDGADAPGAVGRRAGRGLDRPAIGEAPVQPHDGAIPPCHAGNHDIRDTSPDQGNRGDVDRGRHGQQRPFAAGQDEQYGHEHGQAHGPMNTVMP